MNRKTALDGIAESLSRFKSEVEILSKEGLYDINLHSENVLIPLLNEAYNLTLVNANKIRKNYPGIDLIDQKNRIAFQVTATPTISKVKHTLKQFVDHKLSSDIDILFVYILTSKQSSYKADGLNEIIGDTIDFNPSNHIIDSTDIFSLFNASLQLEKILKADSLLKAEFSDQKIEDRKILANNKEIYKTEKIYPNVLKISLKQPVYIADLNIDRDDIIKRSWETEYKLNRRATDRKVVMRALELLGAKVTGDWHVFEKKIISFNNFHSSNSDLGKIIAPGTMEEFDANEFQSLGFKYQSALSQLINHSIRQKLYSKHIKWVDKDHLYRFSPTKKLAGVRKIEWKNIKKATRKVIDEKWNAEETQIIAFKHLAFKINIQFFDNDWYLAITPTWSFTWNGYSKSKLESKLLSGIKRLENNKSIYLSFKFISYCLINDIPDQSDNYPNIDFSSPFYDNVVYPQ